MKSQQSELDTVYVNDLAFSDLLGDKKNTNFAIFFNGKVVKVKIKRRSDIR